MDFFKTALVFVNSVLILLTLLWLDLSSAQDGFESAPAQSAFFGNPLLSFTKLQESLSGVNWDSYFGGDTQADAAGKTVEQQPVEYDNNSNNESYLDPNGPNVQFILFTRKHKPYNLKLNVHDDFVKSGFNLRNPTKIIIHGFLSSTKEDIFILNKNAYMETDDFNVIGMDWSVLCEFEYFTAMRGAQIAGAALGTFINYLISEGVLYDDIHLIGHSLGAHVAAMGADKVKGGKVHRITGLDPAGPGYNLEVSATYRLDPTDAQLVDIIHTNMRALSLSQPQGHLDFYPNGGKIQPGCPNMYEFWSITNGMECNHGRAYRYFAESIRNKHAFRTYRCPSVEEANLGKCLIETDVYMGQEDTYKILDCSKIRERVDFTFRAGDWQFAVRRCNEANISWYGLYYLKTNAEAPFSLS